jgi:glycosyltransferase involved in cell wall biosynthesis
VWRVSAIIPALDEKRRIAARLAMLSWLGLHEVLVVDGASRDATARIASSRGAHVLGAAEPRVADERGSVRAAAGGFPDLPLFEDLALARRLRRIGWIRTVPAGVRVSGRRFHARPIHDTVLANGLPALYGLGVPPRWFARWYGDPHDPR